MKKKEADVVKTDDWIESEQKGRAKKSHLRKRVEPMTLYCNFLQNLRGNTKFPSLLVPLLSTAVLVVSWYCTGYDKLPLLQIPTSG